VNAPVPLPRAVAAEFTGTAALLCAVIGSGVMAQGLAGGNAAVALLANTLATVFALFVLIETLAPVSGAHFNPLVTLSLAALGPGPRQDRWRAAGLYIAAQLAGAVAGAWLANAMFGLAVLQLSGRARDGAGLLLGEAVATAGLLFVVLRAPPGRGAALVASFIGAAYWFTSSTSFANPAAVAGRMLSDSFAGIAPHSAPAFVLAQALGAVLGVGLATLLRAPQGSRPA